MKKFILALALVLVFTCLFVVGISAKEYSPKTVEEVNTALTEIASSTEDNTINLGGEGADYTTGVVDNGFVINTTSTLTFNLTSNITLGCRFYITSGDVIFNLNGYKSTNNTARNGSVGSQFFLDNEETNLEVYNGDIYINDVCFWPKKGNIKAENVDIECKEESVWTSKNGGATGNALNLKNCTIKAGTVFCVENGCLDGSGVLYTIEGCTLTGIVNIHCPKDGSVIKNTTVNGAFTVDSWHKHNAGAIDMMTIDNITVTGATSLWSGCVNIVIIDSVLTTITLDGDRTVNDTHIEVIDCVYTMVAIGTKSSKSSFTDTKTATCLTGGSRTVFTSSSLTETIDEEYATQNPALGHAIDKEEATGVAWENFFENGAYCGVCSRCQEDTKETTPSASPLFENKGLSYAEYQDTTKSMTQAFKVNTDMLAYLEDGYDFGIIATVNKDGSEIAPALNGEGVVSASFAKSKYSIFNVKVTNIPESSKETKIVFCAYLVNGDKTYYLNDGATATAVVGLDYKTVSKEQ